MPAGDVSFWQAAIRDSEDELYEPLSSSMRGGHPITLDRDDPRHATNA